MQKLSIKKIVDFRSKSDRSKKHFINTLKADIPKPESDGGGDYWVSCLSAINNCYRLNDIELISKKRIELEEKFEETEYQKTKTMYKRNIDILYKYEDLDLRKWQPPTKMEFIKKQKENSILTIKGLQIQVTPNHVFSFKGNGLDEIGAIWFIAKLNGFNQGELGMFADILYEYLKVNFSKNYSINSKYCIAVDVFNNFEISFSQLEDGNIPFLLNSTLDEMKKFF